MGKLALATEAGGQNRIDQAVVVRLARRGANLCIGENPANLLALYLDSSVQATLASPTWRGFPSLVHRIENLRLKDLAIVVNFSDNSPLIVNAYDERFFQLVKPLLFLFTIRRWFGAKRQRH